MGRPKSTAVVAADDGIDTDQIKKDCESSDQLAQIEQGITAEQLQFALEVGVFRTSDIGSKFFDTIKIKTLLNWRDSKNYKNLRFPCADGTLIRIKNFEELCSALGVSYNSAYEWISNYQALGDDFLRAADAAGIGVRDLRRLRKLPPDEIEAAKELLATDGKQGVIEFVEDLCAKQAKEKQALEKKITHLSADAEAHEKLIVNKNKKIDELDREIHDLRKHTKDWHPRALDVCLEVREAGPRVLEAVDRLHALRDAILTEDFGPGRGGAPSCVRGCGIGPAAWTRPRTETVAGWWVSSPGITA